jgi:hypothetical protein
MHTRGSDTDFWNVFSTMEYLSAFLNETTKYCQSYLPKGENNAPNFSGERDYL